MKLKLFGILAGGLAMTACASTSAPVQLAETSVQDRAELTGFATRLTDRERTERLDRFQLQDVMDKQTRTSWSGPRQR